MGGPKGGPSKNLGDHGPTRAPLRIATGFEYVIRVDDTFFTKYEQHFRAKHLEGEP